MCLSPDNFPAGYYWYGGKQKGPGRPLKWVERFLHLQSQGTDITQTEGSVDEAPQSLQTVQDILLPYSNNTGGGKDSE